MHKTRNTNGLKYTEMEKDDNGRKGWTGLDYYCIGCHTDCMAFAYGKISSLSNPDTKPKWNQVHNSWHAHDELFAATVGDEVANAAGSTNPNQQR